MSHGKLLSHKINLTRDETMGNRSIIELEIKIQTTLQEIRKVYKVISKLIKVGVDTASNNT